MEDPVRTAASSPPRAWLARALHSRGLQTIAVALALAWLLGRWLETAGGPEALRERFGAAAPALAVPLHALLTFLPMFGEATAVANALLFGFWVGSAVSFSAWLLNAWLQYAMVRRTARDFDFDAHLAGLPAWLRRLPVSHPLFLIGVRVPFGGPIVNIAAGAFGVPLWRHTWCAALGIAPRALFFSALATGWLRL